MPIISGGGGGGGLTIPSTTVSSPAGTTLVLDASGDLILSGTDGNFGTIAWQGFGGSGELNSQSGLLLNGANEQIRVVDTVLAVFQVNAAQGKLSFQFHAAPASGDLDAGECALWFDQTNGVGNTKLMVKGKSADGTVKTAAIVLA